MVAFAKPALPAQTALALRYGVPTQQAMRKSEYLADALRQMNAEGGKDIRSGGELAAKLLATAILQRGNSKAQDATLAALRGDQDAESARRLADLGGDELTPPAGAVPPPASPPPQAPQQAPPAPVQPQLAPMSPPPPGPAPTGGPSPLAAVLMGGSQPGVSPEVDQIVRTVAGEARGEPPEGQSAVASVILNRAAARGQTPSAVVHAKGQFEPWSNPKSRAIMESLDPNSPQYQAILRNIAPALSGQDPTGGADHFYSPSAQQALGRPAPSWDNGKGRDLGRHRFFDLEPGPTAGAQPFQVAANGPTPPGPMPSAPAPASPAGDGGAPPAPVSPQVAGAGGNWRPTPEMIAYAKQLMNDPRTHEQGVAYADKLIAKSKERPEYTVQTVNGVPYYMPKDPGQGAMQPIGVPQDAMSRTRTAQEAGIAAPPGTTFNVDPLGNAKEISRPATGQMATSAPGQPYAETWIPNSSNDPYRPQQAAAGYHYTGAGQQAPVPGSQADPASPMNRFEGLKQLRAEVQPVVQQAIQLKRNISAVQTGYQQQNGAGDIAMVNGLQKLIDEGVVREGDVALQLSAQGINGGIAGVQGFLQSSGKFDPAIRSKILNTANSLYGSMNSTYKDRVLGYRGITERTFGPGAFDDVFAPETGQSLGWSASPGQPPGPAPGPARAPVAPGPAGSRAEMLRTAVARKLPLTPAMQAEARQLGLLP